VTALDSIDVRQRPATEATPLRIGRTLDRAAFDGVRHRMMLHHFKWDAQVGDIGTLAPFPLHLRRRAWHRLRHLAEALAAESMAAEQELIHRPDLHRALGISWSTRRAMRAMKPAPRDLPRLMRFDFHWTTDGCWRISEVNADVPGGLCESSAFPALMAEQCREGEPAGNPASLWADAIADVADATGHCDIALLTAPGYMEDHQVMAYLSRELTQRGLTPHLANPTNLRWNDHDATARLDDSFAAGTLAAIVRFFQAEWLSALPRPNRWRNFFRPSRTPILNTAASILLESKRFPLVWDALRSPLPTWRAVLPPTFDPRDLRWRRDDSWLLKTAFCNTGDSISARDLLDARAWRTAERDALRHPDQWIAQRRFHVEPLDSPIGAVRPCIGVYTINGNAAGIYGRLSTRPVVDYRAIDVAVLIDHEQPSDQEGAYE
jgi:glutathionylspermidine synthase